jgi:group I intron endonuclease
MVAAIYAIRNTLTRKSYIGKSINLQNRFVRHRYLLNAGKHWNVHLQRSWDKYGSNIFQFEVLEECDESSLPTKEQEWIDKLMPEIYNLDREVVNKHHAKNPFFGKKHTFTTKLKMSLAKMGKYEGVNNPNYGKKVTGDTRRKMATNRATKLQPDDVMKIRSMLSQGHKHLDIALKFGVSRTVITRINSGARWSAVS